MKPTNRAMVPSKWSLCQRAFKAFMLLSAFSCAQQALNEKLPPIDAVPVWFRLDARYSDMDEQAQVAAHPFFDLTHFAHPQDLSLNFYPLTAAGSSYYYGLDLVSGKRYRLHRLIEQRDIWERYPRSIKAPPYTEGIVPRLIDPMGMPQKIVVFGEDKYYASLDLNQVRSFRVRVVGGVLEQYCSHYPCSSLQHKWTTRLVLVAVDTHDPKLASITSMEELKKNVDWPYVEAYWQNAGGRLMAGDEDYPAYRLIRSVDGAKALGHVLKKDYVFTFEKMKSLREGCLKLGDYLWASSQHIRKQNQLNSPLQTPAQNMATKIRQLNTKTVIDETPKEKLPKEIENGDFATFFYHFSKNYGSEYQTCIKYVRNSWINEDPTRFWFFAQIDAVMHMFELGYKFDCKRHMWVTNPYTYDGKREEDAIENLRQCSSAQLDQAFTPMMLTMNGLKQNLREHYRFLEYDNGAGGTHQKIFSWVFSNGKIPRGGRHSLPAIDDKGQPVFPHDVEWAAMSKRP